MQSHTPLYFQSTVNPYYNTNPNLINTNSFDCYQHTKPYNHQATGDDEPNLYTLHNHFSHIHPAHYQTTNNNEFLKRELSDKMNQSNQMTDPNGAEGLNLPFMQPTNSIQDPSSFIHDYQQNSEDGPLYNPSLLKSDPNLRNAFQLLFDNMNKQHQPYQPPNFFDNPTMSSYVNDPQQQLQQHQQQLQLQQQQQQQQQQMMQQQQQQQQQQPQAPMMSPHSHKKHACSTSSFTEGIVKTDGPKKLRAVKIKRIQLPENSIKKCIPCSTTFRTTAEYLVHEATHHKKGDPKRCPVCHKTFANATNVITHMMHHTEERTYHCQICKESFFDASSLSKHLFVHSKTKPFFCEICRKEFTQKGNLKKHMLSRHKQVKHNIN